MPFRFKLFLYIISLACLPASTWAQTKSLVSNLANPAISFVAQFGAEMAPDLNQPFGPRFEEAELVLQSTVDQHWTLNALLIFAEEEVAPEEVFATTSIQDVQFKIGKMKTAFGKHALLHAHAFPFIQAPLALANVLGEEGFNDAGVEAAWLTPLPWFCELTGGAYGAVEAGPECLQDFGSADHWNIPWLGHLKNVFDLTDDTTMELGFSVLTGGGFNGLTHAVYGGDLTFKSVPARQSNQSGWILQGEYMKKVSYGAGTFNQEQDGWYASFQYRFAKQWWAGIRAEEAFNSSATGLTDGSDDPLTGHIQRASANLIWAPSEFSAIRVEYSIERVNPEEADAPLDHRAMAQFIYSIGAHPAHAY
jgi:hypothetical protein